MTSGAIQGLGFLAVEVTDLDAASDFYGELLGMEAVGRDVWPHGAASRQMRAGGQHVFLVQNPEKSDPPESGTHQAYRVSSAGKAAIAQRLRSHGVAIETYCESRPEEIGDNFYFLDPSDNRIQLVVSDNRAVDGATITGIDHACVEDFDLQWTEEFYAGILNFPIAHWYGLRTEDYVEAEDWGAGRRDMAPAVCRKVRYYRDMPGHNRIQSRPSLQIYLRAGSDVVGVYMTMDDYAEPPEEQLTGSPCLGFSVAPGRLGEISEALERAGWRFEGPVAAGSAAPIGKSIYCKDTGGNFLAFCETSDQ